jgi:hypothetical protein
MIRTILIGLAAVTISMGLGGFMAIWQCSQRTWCPRYLQRRLDAWRSQMVRQNEERRSLRVVPKEHPGKD